MSEEPLSTVGEVAARTGEDISLDSEVALAEAMIEAASAQVRHYGRPWPLRANAPAIARTIATAAASRGYQNPSGYTDERSDSVTLKRADAYAADVELTPSEIQILREHSGRSGAVRSVRIDLGADRFVPTSQEDRFGFVRRDPREGVPVDSGVHTPFPLYRRRRGR